MNARIKAAGAGAPITVEDAETGAPINGIIGISFVASPKGVACNLAMQPGDVDVVGDETNFYLVDPVTGKHRRVTSIVWAPNAKGQQEVWKPGK